MGHGRSAHALFSPLKLFYSTLFYSIHTLFFLTFATPHILVRADPIPGLDSLLQRRISSIVTNQGIPAAIVKNWLNSLREDGTWPDIDYTTGCDGRRADWLARRHWERIGVLATVWYGPVQPAIEYRQDPALLIAINSAMNWWFDRDYTSSDCLFNAGNGNCPCGTPGLWNLNWFQNVIGIPNNVAYTCLLLSDVLTETQEEHCSRLSLRGYKSLRSGQQWVAGANVVSMAAIGIDHALRVNDFDIIRDAFQRAYSVVSIQESITPDGIYVDGAFGQHLGLLYNGNYGVEMINKFLGLEVIGAGTIFAAPNSSRTAFATLVEGSRWMTIMNAVTNVSHWDLSVLSRFVSMPTANSPSVARLGVNVAQLRAVADAWNSSSLKEAYAQWTKNATHANVGPLNGLRNYYRGDYFVRRGKNYVTSIKGYSQRTRNSECTNLQNPFGFHLSDFLTYQYIKGNEYEDISAAWNWDLLPGTTVDYKATPLNCETVRWYGVESFAGGASAGDIGVFAQRFTNPISRTFGWRKSSFFFKNDTQHIVISNIKSSGSAPIYSVLDQRRRVGDPYVNFNKVNTTSNFTTFSSLWHGDVGYLFSSGTSTPTRLSVAVGNRSGTWSDIGIGTVPPISVNMFTAYLHHRTVTTPVSYSVFPGVSLQTFRTLSQKSRLQTLSQGDVHAVFDAGALDLAAVFWVSNKTFEVPSFCKRRFAITSDKPGVLLLSRNFKMTISDPSQKLAQIKLTFALKSGSNLPGWGSSRTRSFTVQLPRGKMAGSAVGVSVSTSACS